MFQLQLQHRAKVGYLKEKLVRKELVKTFNQYSNTNCFFLFLEGFPYMPTEFLLMQLKLCHINCTLLTECEAQQ